MPVIQKYTARGTPSGKTSTVAPPWPGSMTAPQREMANFGEVAGRIANDWGQRAKKAYIQNQVSQYENQTGSDWAETWASILQDPDPDNQQKALNEFEKRARGNIKPLSHSAKSIAHQWLNAKMPAYKERVLVEGRKAADRSLINQYNLAVDIVKNDDLAGPEDILRIGERLKQLGTWSEEEETLAWDNAQYAINRQRIQKMALDDLATIGVEGATKRVRNSTLEEADQRTILGLVHSMDAYDRYQAEGAKREYELEMVQTDLNTSPSEFLSMMKGGPLDAGEQDRLFRMFLFRQKAVNVLKENDPLMHRRNHDLYFELYKKAIAGEFDQAEALAAVGFDEDNPETTGIAINDFKELKNISEDDIVKARARVIDYAMDEMDGYFADLASDVVRGRSKQALRTAKIKARMVLEERIRAADAAEKPLEGEALLMEMMRVQSEVQNAMGSIRSATKEEILPIGLREGVAGSSLQYPRVDLEAVTDADEQAKLWETVEIGEVFRHPSGKLMRREK